MIFTNHHLLFVIIAHDSLALDHPACKAWWARRATSAFQAVRWTPASDPELVRANLALSSNLQAKGIPDWDSLYKPAWQKSIDAVAMALRRGLPVYSASYFSETIAIHDVIAWLNGLGQAQSPMIGKLSRVTWLQAVNHARNWQAKLEKQQQAQIELAGSEGTTPVLGFGKYHWVRLDTADAIRREGIAMQNCLVEGHHDGLAMMPGGSRREGLFSLRDKKGKSTITALILSADLREAYGRCNHDVPDRLWPLVQALLEHLIEPGSQKPPETGTQT